jgi:hypothetical protein
MWIVYIGFGLSVLLFVGFFGVMLVASIMDWHHYRQNRVWIELQRPSYKRRPAAK